MDNFPAILFVIEETMLLHRFLKNSQVFSEFSPLILVEVKRLA